MTRPDDEIRAGAPQDLRVGDPRTDFDRQVDALRESIEERVDQFTEAYDHTYTGMQYRIWDVVETFPREQEATPQKNIYTVEVQDNGPVRTEEAYNENGYRYQRKRRINPDGDGSLGKLTSLVVGDYNGESTGYLGDRVQIDFTEEGAPERILYRSKGEKELIQLTRSATEWAVTSQHHEKNVGWHMDRINGIVNERKTPQGAERKPYFRNAFVPLRRPAGLKI